MSRIKKDTVLGTIYFLFIFLFLYAAVSKLIDFPTFRGQLSQSPLLTAFASWTAWLVPALEILISMIIALKPFRLYGLYGAFGLMLLFTGYIAVILNYHLYVPCSCGGILQQMGWRQHLYFNVGFVVLGLIAIFLYPDSSIKNFRSNPVT